MFRMTRGRNLRLGTSGEDVRAGQQLLRAAGFDPGAVDGVFGPRTQAATKAFQKAHGLKADGVIGPIAFAALTTPGAPSGNVRGRSVHIGLNVVDNVAYGMPVPALRGCENDARDMFALTQSQGFTPTMLLSEAATSTNVVAALTEAANELQEGDFFLLSYSGHGSQLHDVAGDEPDSLDETWALYDRQLLDDELYALWGGFRPGVRIVVLSDSCHGATVTRDAVFAYKAFASSYQDSREVGFVLDTPIDMGVQASRDVDGLTLLRESLREVVPSVVSQLYGRARTAVLPADVDLHVELVLNQLQGDVRGLVLKDTPVTRNLPAEVSFEDANRRRDLYGQAKRSARGATPPQAHVLLLSGCQDNQLSLDGTRNGLFTQRLLETWNQGAFSGVGYPDLHRQILSLMPPQQTPNLFWATPPNPTLEHQRPFTI